MGWLSLGLAVATGTGLLALYNREKRRKVERLHASSTVGMPSIGGPFKLVDHEGKVRTEKDLGGYSLLYFGFTHCPDICPDELEKMARAADMVQKKAKRSVTPVFVSVDPERDTVHQVKRYVRGFHEGMVGLTGSPEACEKAAKNFRVFYHKTDEEPNGDYLIDHSIIMYLLDPSGNFVAYYGRNHSAESMADDIARRIRSAPS